MTRESLLARTLVELADTSADDFDVDNLLRLLADRCVAVLDVQAAGVTLAASDGRLGVVASSSEAGRVRELFELQAEDGPCVDCHRTGQPVVNQDLDESNGRWPRFSIEAPAAGYHSAHALPMHHNGSVIGVLNLLRTDTGEMGIDDLSIGQAFADVATIAILQHGAKSDAQQLVQQLTHALSSRVVIEQAKGVVFGRLNFDMEQSFATLRNYARSHRIRLNDVAKSIIDGSLATSELDAGPGGLSPLSSPTPVHARADMAAVCARPTR